MEVLRITLEDTGEGGETARMQYALLASSNDKVPKLSIDASHDRGSHATVLRTSPRGKSVLPQAVAHSRHPHCITTLLPNASANW